MPRLSHIAINADDPEATKDFYHAVFGWNLQAWGPPGFYRVDANDPASPGVAVAVQGRRELVAGQRTVGFEATIDVEDVDATTEAVIAAGGRVLHERVTIPGVGHLVWLGDPAGNVFGAMQYDENAG
ncbi:MAG: VOC family protein [Marmoricola sp.]